MSTLTACLNCKKAIDSRAVVCPRCGANQNVNTAGRVVGRIACILVFSLFLIYALANLQRGDATAEASIAFFMAFIAGVVFFVLSKK